MTGDRLKRNSPSLFFKLNCNYNKYTPLQLVQSFVANKQGITLKRYRILGKEHESDNMQMTFYFKKYNKVF